MDFLKLLKSKHVIIWDGAMGTNLTQYPIPKCNEELNLSHPEIIKSVHVDFLKAGAQVIETNTFGANRISLLEYGLENKVREINIAAVKIARDAGGSIISGSIGPTSKLPTLGHINFNEMVSVYREQASALLEGGVDILQIETCQDILQAKAAAVGCQEALEKGDRLLFTHQKVACPLLVTMTIEPSGTTLLGTEVGAALTALLPYGIAAFGLNCATGPSEMEEHIRYLLNSSPIPIAILPNAGLPEIRNGIAHYPLLPDKFAEWMEYFVNDLGVQIVGGCCGTTPKHIDAVVNKLQRKRLLLRQRRTAIQQISSLYSAVSIDQEPRPLIIGERMNINGSREFKEHILSNNFDAAATMAKKQAETGAHVLDLSIAYAGRDEVQDMHGMARRLATASPLPIMIDSTNPDAIEAALSHLGGRSIINSINLEDGGKKAEKILSLAKRFGSALVALTIDEDGMALTAAKKIEIAKRLIKFCSNNNTIFIDPLTFTLADPKAAEAGSARETLDALKSLERLKRFERGLTSIRSILGISNISYGLRPEARHVLNSIFLHEAVEAGLDAAIVHAGQILPIHKIDSKVVILAKDLIYCKNKNALLKYIEYFDKTKRGPLKPKLPKSPKEVLKSAIIDGNKTQLAGSISVLLKHMSAADIINKTLFPAMQKVGEMFGAGELALPFVLQSAETMRAAIDFLSPRMSKNTGSKRGKIVIATVRGDVHDIGKNLVDIIFSNNGYEVINLGVKQPIDAILKSAIENKVTAIGLSGLLVQSCLVMKDDLAELAHRGISIPVICGGAALTRKFVESELKKVYKGPVHYASDAFEGLRIINKLKP